MNKLIVTFILFFSISFNASTQTLYVKAGESGTGYSWKSPLGSLQKALRIAAPGTEVWVAKGTYFPSECEECTPKDRAMSFEIPTDIQLYGGFEGFEGSLEERNLTANPTILSGNIGREDHLDNSQTVVYFKNANENTVLDGFFIIEGYADAEGTPGSKDRSGAGLFNVCTTPGGSSTPAISNCRFMDNNAWEGGAVFNQSEKGIAAPTFSNCNFVKNKANLAGGAVLDNSTNQIGHSTFTDCKFLLNEATFGGGYFTNKAADADVLFNNCKFIKNISAKGPAGFIMTDGKEITWDAKNCLLNGNKATEGTDFFLCKSARLPSTTIGENATSEL